MTRNFSTIMKSTAAVAFLTMLTIATATNAFAQQQAARGKVPFSFTVGTKVLPAGEYVAFPLGDCVLEIRSADGRAVAVITGSRSYDEPSGGGNQLIFDRIGESYFLRRVLSSERIALNLQFRLGQAEKVAGEREAGLQASREVVVAMR